MKISALIVVMGALCLLAACEPAAISYTCDQVQDDVCLRSGWACGYRENIFVRYYEACYLTRSACVARCPINE